MKWSLYLGKVFGTKIYVHWTFLILIGWILILYLRMGKGLQESLVGVGFVLTIFICIVLHELGHVFTANQFGIYTKNITLLPIGGMANMEKMPEKPIQELLVSISGLIVNVIIALGIYAYLSITDKIPTLEELEAMQEANVIVNANNFLFNLMIVNVVLFVFNLIPAFPMDGGRVLRALLSLKLDRGTSTKIAAAIGQILAIFFVFFGFFSNIWLVLIGIFIYVGAGMEAQFEVTKSVLSGFKVKDVLMKRFTMLSPADSIDKAVGILLDSQEREFLIGEGNTVDGILTRDEIIKGLRENGKDAPVSSSMKREYTKLNPDMELKDVYQKMTTSDETVNPVFDDGELVGILDKENISELVLVHEATVNNP